MPGQGGQGGAVQLPLPYVTQNTALTALLVGRERDTQQHLQQAPKCNSSLGGFYRDLCITWNWGRQKPTPWQHQKHVQKATLKIPKEEGCCVSAEHQVVKEAPAPSPYGLRLVSLQAMGFYPLLALAAQCGPPGLFVSLALPFRNIYISHFMEGTCSVGNTASGNSHVSRCWGTSFPQYLVGHQQEHQSAS